MRTRSFVRVLFAVLMGLALPAGATAQAVLQMVTVKVNPGKMDAYRKGVSGLQGVMDRLGGGGKVSVWQATQAGVATGNTLVTVGFPSLAAFADVTTKSASDAEWQRILAGFEGTRTVLSNGLAVSQDAGGVPEPPAAGSVLQGVLVKVNPGQHDAYMAKIDALKKAQERLGSSGTMRVWQATQAGANTGMLAVGITHPSLADFAANTDKLQGDAEAQKLLGSLDGIRTLVSSSLFVAQ